MLIGLFLSYSALLMVCAVMNTSVAFFDGCSNGAIRVIRIRIRIRISIPLLSHKRGHLFATAAKGQNITTKKKKTPNNSKK